MGAHFTLHPLADEILTRDAITFLTTLHRRFNPRRIELLGARRERQARLDAGERPDFLTETASVRRGEWQVAPVPKDLLDRRVELTGPVSTKTMINALNSDARVFMADFEDASSPTWSNMLYGQRNVRDAHLRKLRLETCVKTYELNDETATLVVRPRGWHLTEKNFEIDGDAMSASLFDFGLMMFHSARAALDAGTAPYFYLPKLESHLEARLWNDAFIAAQDYLHIPQGTIKATVLIETITAAFEQEEILYELRQHSAGLNAGCWDYTESMVATCHKRGAHAIGGMAAFIPNRRDPEVTEAALANLKADKRREAADGSEFEPFLTVPAYQRL